MTQRKFSASLSRSQGREGWSVIFSHPMPARGKPGLRVRRGLSTKQEDEARELVGQLNDILGDQQFWQTSARSRAEARFDQRVVTIFYSYLVPETVDSFQVRNSVIRLPERSGSHISALLLAENLLMGAFTRRDRAGIAQDQEQMMTLFPRLRERLHQTAGTLSGGEQQMLATARALMARPRLLLMDEPSMGLAPMLVGQVFETIRKINAQGVTILLVEQNALQALSIADQGYVLESGRIALSGAGRELLGDERVKRAYLG